MVTSIAKTATTMGAIDTARTPLLVGETEIATTPDRRLRLTTQRMIYSHETSGASRFVSITLDSVSSCSVNATSAPILIVIGILLVCVGLATIDGRSDTGGALVIIGVTLALSYLASRSASLVISSNGGERVGIPVSPSKRADFIAFANAIDSAKLALRMRRA
jgi:hypothetical protein